MSKEGVDRSRRRFLTATASVVGGAGVVAAAVPFVTYMTPSDRARAAGAPIEVDISKVELGQKINVKWRGQVVWVLHRTKRMLDDLPKLNDRLNDPLSKKSPDQQPAYAQNLYRSIKPDYFVVIGICTHLGCSPTYRPEIAPEDLGPDWLGGFFCPCHGSRFDLAGRVFQGVPAQINLKVPPYFYVSDAVVRIGEDKGKGAA